MPSKSKAPGPDNRFSLTRADASEQIAYEIRRHIERQGLQPGDRIGTEQELANEFGVSRPTLREALRLLAGSHLIRASQGRGGGIFVANTAGEGMGRHMSEAIGAMLATESVSLYDLLEARMVLEVPLAGLAAASTGPETIEQLEQAIADAEGHKPGSEPFNQADSRFHQTIAEAGGNDVLIAFTRWILDVLLPSLIDYIGPSISADDILGQHRAILRAIRRGQSTAAERAMREHLEHLVETLRSLDAAAS
jgi:GntR family transcriptional regulator, transcriptional repressor for pyruvate dehydrogenase complex